MNRLTTLCAMAVIVLGHRGITQDEASRAEALELEGFEHGRYFLIDPQGGDPPEPGKGRGLLVVLPGGDGGADFLPFVENGIVRSAAPDGFVGAMVTAVQWTDRQRIVWPTRRSRVAKMRYPTEEYVAAVVEDVGKRRAIDPARVYLLAWSSSGPAAYEIALQREQPFAGFYIAMSVFRPARAALPRADGRRFLLDQSPDDETTPFRFAEEAREQLAEHGAVARLVTYAGGHGWHDAPIARLRDGLAWLAGAEPPPPPTPAATAEVQEPEPPAAGENLCRNGGFEDGKSGWLVLDNSKSLRAETDSDHKREGAQSLHLTKDAGLPLDLVRQDIDLPAESKSVQVSAFVRSRGAKNAFVKLFVYDGDDRVVNRDVDLCHLRGDRDWERVARTQQLPDGAVRAVFMVVLVLGGEVWVDDVRVVAVR